MGTGKIKKKTKRPAEIMGIDRISALSDHIILHILSFLPTNVAVRMSILSKRWRYLWAYLSVLNFPYDSDMDDNEIEVVYKFLGQCWENLEKIAQLGSNISITKFKLKVRHVEDNDIVLDRWICYALRRDVKEFELCLHSECNGRYFLPYSTLHAISLTSLKLEWLDFDLSYSPIAVNLPSLRSLHLHSVSLDDKMLHSFILGCPSVENLILEGPMDSCNPLISSTSLKFFEVREASFVTIQVKAPNLLSFTYQQMGGEDDCVDINLVACGKLTHLSLSYVGLNDHWLEGVLRSLPLLKTLSLDGCFRLQYLKIFSVQLKELYLGHWKHDSFSEIFSHEHEVDLAEIILETPNLVSFCYFGPVLSKVLINAPNLLETNLHFFYGIHEPEYDMLWYIDLLHFLATMVCSENLILEVPSPVALIFPEKLRTICRPPLSNVKKLTAKAWHKDLSESDFNSMKDSLLWCAPSVELSIAQK